MAKKLGSLDSDKVVPINPAAEAREETRSNVTSGTFLEAVREIAKINEKAALVNEERKGVRKKWKANGIELGVLDATLKMADWDRAEVRGHFDVARQYAEWLGLPIGTQTDLFKGMDDDAIQRKEWRAIGRTASRTGKPGRPPEECPPEFHQDFMAGFSELEDEEWEQSEKPEAGAVAPVKPGKKDKAIPPAQVDAIAEHLQAEDAAGAEVGDESIDDEDAVPQAAASEPVKH